MSDWWKTKDPDARSEENKYSKPVPSRSFILKYFNFCRTPLSYESLCVYFELKDSDQLEGLRFRLKAMCREGQLTKNRKKHFCLPDKKKQKSGRIQANKEGFGFFIPDDKTQDFFLSPAQMQFLWHGDRVLLQVSGKVCHIVEVLERAFSYIVGIYQQEENLAFVVPENPNVRHKIIIKSNHLMPKSGQYVVVEILSHPKKHELATGQVSQIIDISSEVSLDILIAKYTYGLASSWSQDVIDYSKHYTAESISEEIPNRKDLRELPFITIDGSDAKDFDDAVYVEPKNAKEWRLLVAIADVSHYVKPGDCLDVEAESRGTSVYFPGHVVPMLPEILSNDLCSLKPNVDRLSLVCEMTVSHQGKVTDFIFYNAVIKSCARCTYDEVFCMLNESNIKHMNLSPAISTMYPILFPHLKNLESLYYVLNKNRMFRGALEFDTQEANIVFGVDHQIDAIVASNRHEVHRMIEECMLSANESAAKLLEKSKLPALYRVHKGPTAQKQTMLFDLLKDLGIPFEIKGKMMPKDYQIILENTQDHEASHSIQMTILRSLGQAEYRTSNTGHFGLAFEAYTHFTSPIRRYPDLLVHRAIKFIVQEKQTVSSVEVLSKQAMYPYILEKMEQLGLKCSALERQAEEASRYAIKGIICRYMQNKIGEKYTGKVVSVTNFGLFVELDAMPVTGLIPVSSLTNDYYSYQEKTKSLMGQASQIIFSLGTPVSVFVHSVNMEEKHIQLEWISDSKNKKKGKIKNKKGLKKR